MDKHRVSAQGQRAKGDGKTIEGGIESRESNASFGHRLSVTIEGN
jgi:hypothetical protein